MSDKKFDIISIGDSTIDHFVIFHDAEVNCKINKEICQMCINYGDKLPVDKYVALTAGNAGNNAIGTARLGLKAAYYVVLGEDEGGFKIKSHLLEEGVSPDYIDMRENDETNSSFVLSYQGERTILVYHVKHEYKLPALADTEWIYLTSTGPGYENLFKEVIDHVKKKGIKLGFNPGTFQLRGDQDLLRDVIKNCEALFINVEEAQKILQTDDHNPKTLLSSIKDLGPAISIITDGQKGAYSYDGQRYLHMELFNDKRVETTGSGDAFATAFISSLHYGNDIAEAMRWGSINGNSVAQQLGPQNGLLKLPELKQLLDANPNYQPKEM